LNHHTNTNHLPHSNEIALFGEVLADIFPEKYVLGGAPFNVARHLSGFGLRPVLITRTGQDTLKDELLNEMQARHMETMGVQHDPVYPTGQVRVTLVEGNAQYEIIPEQAYDFIHAGMTHMMTIAIKPEIAYFGTLAQRSVTSRLALDRYLSDCKCPRFLDINLRKPWYNKHTISRSLKRADIVKLNDDELTVVAQACAIAGKTPEAQAEALLTKYDLSEVIVTCGANGAWVMNRDRHITHAKANAQTTIVDTVGAGDAFASVYMLGIHKAWDIETRLQRANQFAAEICDVRGAVPENNHLYQRLREAW
jgi:fructokinase